MGKVQKEQIAKILPNRVESPSISLPTREERVEQGFAAAKARAKYSEIRAAREGEEKVAHAAAHGLSGAQAINPEDLTFNQIEKIAAEQKQEKELEALRAEAPAVIDMTTQDLEQVPAEREASLTSTVVVPSLSHSQLSQTLALQGAAKADVVKLLNSLNINLNVQLTKADTANLLACLLTCNESQLHALLTNRKVPIVIKTVIKRLLHDSEKGNIETIEKLWDRVFGKNAMSVNMPEESLNKGLIPNTPISREAYIVIRDTLMK